MRVRLAVVILLVVTSGAAAVSAAAQGSGVTPEAAEQVARDYADANARNNATLDVEGQAAIEDPPIRAIDDATFREYRGRGQTSLGQDIRVEDRRIYVPQQSGYPLRFLSSERVVFGGEPAARQLLLFVKTSESAPWRVSMAAQVVKASLPKLRTDSDGLARLVGADAEPALKVKPDALAPKLAKLWDSGRSTSKTFEPGPLTTGAVDSFVQSLSATGIGQARVRFEFGPAEDRPVCFQTTGRGALCFFVVSVSERLRPRSGSAFVQPDNRQPLTGLVPPGEYRQGSYDRTAILVAKVPKRADAAARIDVIGIYEGIVKADAVSSTTTPVV